MKQLYELTYLDYYLFSKINQNSRKLKITIRKNKQQWNRNNKII
jgi:hypothetical protein